MPPKPGTRARRPGQLPPGRHKFSRAQVVESQRTRIRDGVIEAVAEKGYQQTRLADVVRAAGLSRKAFYEHYADIEEAFLAAQKHHLTALTRATSEAFTAAAAAGKRGSWTRQVRSAVAACLAYLQEHPHAARVCVVDALAASKKARATRDATLRKLSCFVDAGRAEASHEVPDDVGLAVLGGAHELIASAVLSRPAIDLRRGAPDVVYIIVLPFLGPKNALREREQTLKSLDSPNQ